jgi:ribosomal protein S18 acetylase RimI-like enzyme
LAELFAVLAEDGETLAKFSPHPFTEDEARRIACNEGRNLYFGTLDGGELVAYGMLRYTDGYPDPSLALVVRPDRRNKGLGSEMLRRLIKVAQEGGAPYVTLHVNKNNPALNLYQRIGFSLDQSPRRPDELRGVLRFRNS